MTINPETAGVEVSFEAAADGRAALKDTLALLNTAGDPENRLIVVLDGFQEIAQLEPGTDELLRGMIRAMNSHANINYVFLGSDEDAMTSLFEDGKSPFFGFDTVMRLGRIPYDDFLTFLAVRLARIRGQRACEDAREIPGLTKCHPAYTQQLAAALWDQCLRAQGSQQEQCPDDGYNVQTAADAIALNLSACYSSRWVGLNQTNRKVLLSLGRGTKLQDIRSLPTSTVYPAAARLWKEGLLVHEAEYELADPFFAR